MKILGISVAALGALVAVILVIVLLLRNFRRKASREKIDYKGTGIVFFLSIVIKFE